MIRLRFLPLSFALLLAATLRSQSYLLPARIPRVDSAALDGTRVTLPEAQPAVLILGFSRQASEAAMTWGKHLSDASAPSGRGDYYILPMLSGVPKPLRGLVQRSIRKDVSAQGQQHIVPLYADEPSWRKLADVDSADDVYLLVIDAGGSVRWKGKGAYTDGLFGQIVGELHLLQGSAKR